MISGIVDTGPKRPRPKSLHGLSLERSLSIDQHRPIAVQSPQAPLSKTLARLQRIKDTSNYAKSAPSTPEGPPSLDTSPRRKNLAKFLGFPPALYNHHQEPSLSKAKSMDLEPVGSPRATTWQSNEILTTPAGSPATPPCPMPMEPLRTTHGLILRISQQQPPQPASPQMVNSASNSPYHTLGRGKTSTLQRGGLGTITKTNGLHKRLPRSATLDDLETGPGTPGTPNYEPVMWVQRSGSRCHPCCCTRFQGQWQRPQGHYGSLQRPPALQDSTYGSLQRPPNQFNSRPSPDTYGSMPRWPTNQGQQQQQQRPEGQQIYLSMTRRRPGVVVIPLNGFELRESSVDEGGCSSTVVSMGSKTCISVNEKARSLISTKAIVHQK
jgi:hypothetical protein